MFLPPLLTISQLSLCMDGEGEDGIPYATYLASGSTKEVSTLKDVKARLGIEDDSESDSDSTDSSDSTAVTPTPESSDDNGDSTDSSSSGSSDSTSTPDPTSAPASSDSSDADPTEAPSGEDDPASVAARYIGQSMSELENACGSPNGSDYEDEPESGKTGYYYYDTFTVSTTFDNDGNEVVSGVW